jgi:hypothetical protein
MSPKSDDTLATLNRLRVAMNQLCEPCTNEITRALNPSNIAKGRKQKLAVSNTASAGRVDTTTLPDQDRVIYNEQEQPQT